MKRAVVPLLALVVCGALISPALAAIYEVADKDGNVTHYKYTDRKGSVIFTDSLAKIPESVRSTTQVIRVGPPPKPQPPPGEKPAAEGLPAPLPSLSDAFKPVAPLPAPLPPPPQESGGFRWWMAVLGAAVLAGAVLALRAFQTKSEAPRPAPAPARGPERPVDPEALAPPRRERAPAALAPSLEAGTPRRAESPREALERLIQAGDYAGAAQLCDAQGELARGADLYVKAGLYAEAAANFEQVKDFVRAGESHLKAGNPEKAAASFAQTGDRARGYAALAGYFYDQGDPQQAADYAEKAGDLMQAATWRQEIGDLARAADLFFRGGLFAEAAELFSQLGDLPRAAESFAQAGDPLRAAQTLERSGGAAGRAAELYEQGGGYYQAGRLFVKLGDFDRALTALQKIDPAAEDARQASLLVGMIFLKRGLTSLAQEKFVKLIGERPIERATLEPYYFLALCHERSGQADQARSIFEKILAEDYNFRDVKARLANR